MFLQVLNCHGSMDHTGTKHILVNHKVRGVRWMAGMMDYCHCAPVAASNIEEGARHSLSLEPKILGTHYRWEDWVNQQRNLGAAAWKPRGGGRCSEFSEEVSSL